MYLSCIKTYANSLKYTFTVLGIVALGIVIGLGTFGKLTGRAVTTMTQTMKEDYQAADLKLSYITDAVIDRAENFTLGDLLNIIHEKSIRPLLVGEIEDSVEKVVDNYTKFAEKIYEDIVVCVNAIVTALAIGAVLIVLSQVISFFGVEICVRRRLAAVGFGKLFLEMFVRFLMYILAAFIVFGLCTAFQEASTVLLCLLPVLLVLFGLIAAWLTADPAKVSFAKVVNFANFCWMLLANLSMLAATALIGFCVYRLVNIVAAVLVCVSLLTVLLVAMDLSASAVAVKAGETVKSAPAAAIAEGTPTGEAPAEKATAAADIVKEIPASEPTDAEMAVPETPVTEKQVPETEPASTAGTVPAQTYTAEDFTEEDRDEAEAQTEELQNQLKKRLQGKLHE